MNDSNLRATNETRITTAILGILKSIKKLEKKSLKGERINYFGDLGDLYTNMVVLEGYYPDIYDQCKKELGIDYKELVDLIRKNTPILPLKKIKLLEGIINTKIENIIKKIPDIREFLSRHFNNYLEYFSSYLE